LDENLFSPFYAAVIFSMRSDTTCQHLLYNPTLSGHKTFSCLFSVFALILLFVFLYRLIQLEQLNAFEKEIFDLKVETLNINLKK
jgi:hypothetical protein